VHRDEVHVGLVVGVERSHVAPVMICSPYSFMERVRPAPRANSAATNDVLFPEVVLALGCRESRRAARTMKSRFAIMPNRRQASASTRRTGLSSSARSRSTPTPCRAIRRGAALDAAIYRSALQRRIFCYEQLCHATRPIPRASTTSEEHHSVAAEFRTWCGRTRSMIRIRGTVITGATWERSTPTTRPTWTSSRCTPN